MFQFYGDGADKFEYVLMFQGVVDLYFLVYRFALIGRRMFLDVDEFAGCHPVLLDVHCLEHAGWTRSYE